MNTASTPTRRQRGVSLIESAVVLAITAVLAGAAVPSFQEAREFRHLEGAAAVLETDIQLARSEAVLRDTNVRVSFESSGNASCYVVHTGNAGDCHCTAAGPAVCTAAAVALRSVRFDGSVPVAVQSNSPSILVNSTHGTVTPTATIEVLGRNGAAIHQVVSFMGRVRSCSPTPLPGYKTC